MTREHENCSRYLVAGALMVDQDTIVATDVTASNGVIHVIDQVILPEQLRSANKTDGSTAVASNLR